MDYSKLLNQTQLEAVTSSSQYVRIVAGAGSGKTRVLTYRLSYLISEMGVDPRRIIAIAFTNKVAEEMRVRASKLLGLNSSQVGVKTFHSFCAYFLRQESKHIGYPCTYTIFDEDDQKELVRDIGEEFLYKKGDKQVKEALAYIRYQKERGLYPDQVKIRFNTFDEKENLRFYKRYEEKKTSMYALDFDDLLLKTLQILDENPDVREYWSRKYDHILVDEFQDVNDVQYRLMSYLSRPDSCVYVVGDPDQTIYTWRGANQDIILKFDRTHPGTETIILNRNYRSTKSILDVANTLIAKNKNRIPKDLFTEEGEGEKVITRKCLDESDEACYVAREIQNIARKSGSTPNYSQIAVLFRSAYLTRQFETEFAGRGIPYKIFGGLRFYQRREVKDVLAYLRLISNPLDDVSFERIINVPNRKIGEAAVELLRDFAKQNNVSLFNSIELIDDETTEISKVAVTNLRLFREKILETRNKLDENITTFSSTLSDFVTDIGYFDYLVKHEEEDEDRSKNVQELFSGMDGFISSHENASYEEFLQNVTLLTSQDDIKDGNFVSLMTVHVAKGLEFDNVFVICMSDSAFPNPRAIAESGEKGMEEERRLAYVAMTRAKKKLYLTCNTGFSYVVASKTKPSVFFTDAGLPFPAEDPYYDSWKSRNVESSASRGRDFFGDGPHLSEFDRKPTKPAVQPEIASNGITDWKVGDIIEHARFGRGEVISLVGTNVIVVNFESCGNKSLMSSHPMITRVSSKGGQA